MASKTVLIKGSKILLSIFVFLCLGSCITYFGTDGPYEGKVIDVDTSQPIEGAVVHGDWYIAKPGPGGATHTDLDSREMLTDKNGEFKISGRGLLVMSNIEPMTVTILKAGYSQISSYIWNLSISPDVERQGGKAVFKLRRMTLEERKQRLIEMPILQSTKKLKLLRLESNRENTEIGKPSNTLYPVE